MLNDLTDVQKNILAAAAASPDQPIHCNVLLGGRWSVKAGEKVFDGGLEVQAEVDPKPWTGWRRS